MKRTSLYFTRPTAVELREENLPIPATGEVLVKTIVSAISAGTEMLLYRGQMPDGMAVDATIETLASSFSYPLKYGYATVGRVVALGSLVAAEWQDQLIFAFNPHESAFLARPADLLPVPEEMNAETAVFLPNMETAVSFLMDGQPMMGEQVAVFGQGIVGLLTTTLLADLPLSSLITLDRYNLRRTWSLRLGAHASLDSTMPGTLEELKKLLQGQRPYPGADLTFELSGNPRALDQAIAVTGYNGRVLIGSWYGQKRASVDLGSHFHRSHMRLISSQVSQIAPRWNGRWTKERRLQVAWQMLARHQPAGLVTHRFPIEEASQAYALLDSAPETAVQLLFTYGDRG